MIPIIHVMALVAIAFGTLQAFVEIVRHSSNPALGGHRFHHGQVQCLR